MSGFDKDKKTGQGGVWQPQQGSSPVVPTVPPAASTGTGGGRLNRLQPHPQALGAHSSFKRDPRTGAVTNYATYEPQANPQDPNPWQEMLRLDKTGSPHFNKATKQMIPTPHMHDPNAAGGVRVAQPGEVPR